MLWYLVGSEVVSFKSCHNSYNTLKTYIHPRGTNIREKQYPTKLANMNFEGIFEFSISQLAGALYFFRGIARDTTHTLASILEPVFLPSKRGAHTTKNGDFV